MLTFSRTAVDRILVPQIISICGSSRGEWERQRPVWYGDNSRERYHPAQPPKKKAKRNKSGSAVASTREGTNDVEEES